MTAPASPAPPPSPGVSALPSSPQSHLAPPSSPGVTVPPSLTLAPPSGPVTAPPSSPGVTAPPSLTLAPPSSPLLCCGLHSGAALAPQASHRGPFGFGSAIGQTCGRCESHPASGAPGRQGKQEEAHPGSAAGATAAPDSASAWPPVAPAGLRTQERKAV